MTGLTSPPCEKRMCEGGTLERFSVQRFKRTTSFTEATVTPQPTALHGWSQHGWGKAMLDLILAGSHGGTG